MGFSPAYVVAWLALLSIFFLEANRINLKQYKFSQNKESQTAIGNTAKEIGGSNETGHFGTDTNTTTATPIENDNQSIDNDTVPAKTVAQTATPRTTSPSLTSKQNDEQIITNQQKDQAKVGDKSVLLSSPRLKAGVHFQAAVGVDFAANATVSVDGEICLDVDILNGTCPIPHIRARLVGSSLVHIHVARSSETKLNGCATIPIPGLYFLDAMLVHCVMDAQRPMPFRQLRYKCPMQQDDDASKAYVPFNFTLPQFCCMLCWLSDAFKKFPQRIALSL